YLARDSSLWIPVVVVPVDDKLAASLFAGVVSLGTDLLFLIESKVANSFVVRKQVSNRIGAIINNYQLGIRIILAQETTDRLRHEAAAIAGRHDAAYEW